jgi:hypothetical protein
MNNDVLTEARELAEKIVNSIANGPSNQRETYVDNLIKTFDDVYNHGYEQGIANVIKETVAPLKTESTNGAPKKTRYGLPCTKCGTYFDSSLKQCPHCNPSAYSAGTM